MDGVSAFVRGIISVSMWGILIVAAVVFLAFLWWALADFLLNKLKKYSKENSKNSRKILALGIIEITALIAIPVISGIVLTVTAYFCGEFWFYIYAAILLIAFPAITYLVLHDLDEKQQAKRYAENVEKEYREIKKRNENSKENYRVIRGEEK